MANGKRYVVDGPFAESKELVGGFYLIEVDSLDEAVAWALRAPSGFGSDDVLEVRQLTGAEDLPPDLLQRIELLVAHAYEQVFARCRHPRWH